MEDPTLARWREHARSPEPEEMLQRRISQDSVAFTSAWRRLADCLAVGEVRHALSVTEDEVYRRFRNDISTQVLEPLLAQLKCNEQRFRVE